jgi:hypothetical protein
MATTIPGTLVWEVPGSGIFTVASFDLVAEAAGALTRSSS